MSGGSDQQKRVADWLGEPGSPGYQLRKQALARTPGYNPASKTIAKALFTPSVPIPGMGKLSPVDMAQMVVPFGRRMESPELFPGHPGVFPASTTSRVPMTEPPLMIHTHREPGLYFGTKDLLVLPAKNAPRGYSHKELTGEWGKTVQNLPPQSRSFPTPDALSAMASQVEISFAGKTPHLTTYRGTDQLQEPTTLAMFRRLFKEYPDLKVTMFNSEKKALVDETASVKAALMRSRGSGLRARINQSGFTAKQMAEVRKAAPRLHKEMSP